MSEKPSDPVLLKNTLAIVAILISIASIMISLLSYKFSVETRSVSTAPNFEFIRDTGSGFRIVNKGNGTGHITEIAFYVDGKCIDAREGHLPRQNSDNIYQELLNPFGKKMADIIVQTDKPKQQVLVGTSEPAVGQALRTGDSIDVIKPMTPVEPSEKARVRIADLLSKFSVLIFYCSDFNECAYKSSDYGGKLPDCGKIQCLAAT